jgi:hypothetical protein
MQFTIREVGDTIPARDEADELIRDAIESTPSCLGALGDLRGSMGGRTIVEAKRNGKRCGIAVYHLEDRALYLDGLCSDCEGTGKALINKLISQARSAGKTSIRLFSLTSAVGFYEKQGFTLEGDAQTDDGIYMQFPIPSLGGRRKTYRRRKSRRHGSASLRRHKTRRVLP